MLWPQTSAADAIQLSWTSCAGSAGAASDLTVPCVNTDHENAFVSFELASPMDSVVAVEGVVDIQSSAPELPEWWMYQPGGCRYLRLIASASFPGGSGCADFGAGGASLDAPPIYLAGQGGASRARIEFSIVVPSTTPRDLGASIRYTAVRLEIQNQANLDCGICAEPACLALQSLTLRRVRGDHFEDRELGPDAGGSNRVTWQGGAGCDIVPARRSTWGSLKALYR